MFIAPELRTSVTYMAALDALQYVHTRRSEQPPAHTAQKH